MVKMGKKFMGLIAISTFLVGCGTSKKVDADEPSLPKTHVIVVTDWGHHDPDYRELEINGVRCIENVWGEGIGLSCDFPPG